MEEKQALIEAITKHTEDMDLKELELVLRYIYALKDFR